MNAHTVRIITAAIIGVTAFGWIGWDIYAHQFAGATESGTIRRWAMEHPIIPFAIGVLCGHFFGIMWKSVK